MCACIFSLTDNVVSHILGLREAQVKAEAFPTSVKVVEILDKMLANSLATLKQITRHLKSKTDPFNINPVNLVYFACMIRVANVSRRKMSSM